MIASATAAVAPALAQIHAACFTGADAWSAAALVDLLQTPGILALVHDGGGFILLRGAMDEADILTIAVIPAARRQRIGAHLLATALAESRARDIHRVFLEVSAHNHPAIALYRQHGFTQVGERPHYYADGAAALLMVASLDP